MEYTKILKQAWKTVVSYRALWIFGVILALTTFSSTDTLFNNIRDRGDAREGLLGTGVTISPRDGESFSDAFQRALTEAGREITREMRQADRELDQLFRDELGIQMRSNILLYLTVLFWTVVIFFIVSRFLRYISETALIKMVNDQEETGLKHSTRQGFRIGWSRTSWNLFLIDLAINIPAAVIFLLLFVVVFLPLFLLELGITGVGLIGVVLTSGLFFLFIFLAIIVSLALGLLKNFMRRACAIDGLGVFDSIRRGYRLVRTNLKETGLVWLLMAGLGIGFPIVMGIFAVFLVAVSAVVGGGLGLLVGLTANLLGAAEPVLVGAIVGVPLFLLVLIVPLVFLSGLKTVFKSSTWTLTFRELRGRESLEEISLPGLDDSAAIASP